MEGTKKAELCSELAKEGMVDVRSKRCGHQGCSVWPSSAWNVTRRLGAIFFFSARDRECGHKKCDHQGCKKDSSYGVEGTKRRKLCPQYAAGGVADVHHKRCGYQGIFGKEGTKKIEFCRQDARQGMVGVATFVLPWKRMLFPSWSVRILGCCCFSSSVTFFFAFLWHLFRCVFLGSSTSSCFNDDLRFSKSSAGYKLILFPHLSVGWLGLRSESNDEANRMQPSC